MTSEEIRSKNAQFLLRILLRTNMQLLRILLFQNMQLLMWFYDWVPASGPSQTMPFRRA